MILNCTCKLWILKLKLQAILKNNSSLFDVVDIGYTGLSRKFVNQVNQFQI